MSNQQKNERVYATFVDQLEGLARGDSIEDVHRTADRVYLMMTGGGFRPASFPQGDWARQVVQNLDGYCASLTQRKRVNIAGAQREIATEDAAFDSLNLAVALGKELVVPHFRDRSQLSNRLFYDVRNLGLSYVDSIVSGVSDEYISAEDAFMAKVNAVNLAKRGMTAGNLYVASGLSSELGVALDRTGDALGMASPYLLRPFENVATERKNVYRKNELTAKIIEKATARSGDGFEFLPDFIFPIANGGTELGIEIGMAYEAQGARSILVYPLMFSMKTRKQRRPWTEHDSAVLGQSLEGKRVLVAEDWITTGNTLRGILNQVEGTFPQEIRVATLKRDREKSQVPIIDKYQLYVGTHALYDGAKTDSLAGM